MGAPSGAPLFYFTDGITRPFSENIMKNSIYLVGLVNGSYSYDLQRSHWFQDQSEAEDLADALNKKNGFDPENDDCDEYWEVVSVEHGSHMQDLLNKKESKNGE